MEEDEMNMDGMMEEEKEEEEEEEDDDDEERLYDWRMILIE